MLDVLDQGGLIKSDYRSGLLGQQKLFIEITDHGTLKIDEYVDSLEKK